MEAVRRACASARAALAMAAFAVVATLGSCAASAPPAAAYPAERPYPNSSFEESGGEVLHVRTWEPAEPRGRVLLLHGLAGSTFSWRFLAPALEAAGYAVLAVDLPPFGFSSGGVGFRDARAAAELLWELLDRHGGGSWSLVGHSMGGRYAVAMASARPDRTERLVLVDGAVLDSGGQRAAPGRLGRWLVRAWARSALRSRGTMTRLLKSAYGRKPDDGELDGYRAPLAQPGKADALLSWAFSPGEAVPADPAALRVPVLLVWGAEDSWVPLEQGERLAGLVPGARLEVLPGEGHCPMETAPDAVNGLVLGFLGD